MNVFSPERCEAQAASSSAVACTPPGAASRQPEWRLLKEAAARFPVNRVQPGGVPLPSSAERAALFDLRTAFARDAGRTARLSRTFVHGGRWLAHVDFSKTHIDDDVLTLLHRLACAQGVEARRQAMFAGERINHTEGRRVMHWLLREPVEAGVAEPLQPLWREMDAVRTAFLDYAERVRDDASITDIVNIGIGGSDLGPRMAIEALAPYGHTGKRFHFVSNVDGDALHDVLARVKPAHTLFIVASKTFTTLETMTNAATAMAWFRAAEEGRHADRLGEHFVGITTRVESAHALGMRQAFPMWDWVGGRYSVWSAVGLSLAVAIGATRFREFLAGAHAMDRHFVEAPAQDSLPMQLGLLDVWNSSFVGHASRCMAPYAQVLQHFPIYLQQLEMESNGKRVSARGELLDYATCPTVWGESGTNGQHAFFEMLHQGPQALPVEFIAVCQSQHGWELHHELLLANALAQAQALMLGRDDPDPQRCCPGNRPSTFILLPELTPFTLGTLIALYEHRVFVSGAVWGLNSFDQFGVELGKQLASGLAPRFSSGDVQGLDASTADLLTRMRAAM